MLEVIPWGGLSQELSFALLFALGVLIGTISAILGVGGGFFFTPFFHTVAGLTASQAVATSMAQIPLMSLSGTYRYSRTGYLRVTQTLPLLVVAVLAAQVTAIWFARLPQSSWGSTYVTAELTRADLLLAAFYTLAMAPLGIYGIIRGIHDKKTSPTKSTQAPAADHPALRWLTILVVGVLFGALSSLLGIGGGFLAVPFFIYVMRFSAAEAVGTSLFLICATTTITTLQYAWQNQVVWSLSLTTAAGSMLGAQLGSAVSLRWGGEITKVGLGILQLIVVIVYLYAELL